METEKKQIDREKMTNLSKILNESIENSTKNIKKIFIEYRSSLE